MSSPPKRQLRQSTASPLPTAASTSSLVAASRNASGANLSDCAADGLETYDVGEYHLTACPICLEHFTLENPAILLRCEHGFHLQCLESWRQRSTECPMCFAPLIGDEGRIMSPADARRRRRLRLRPAGAAADAPERSALISAAVRRGGAASDCAGADSAGRDAETDVIEVTSAEQDPRRWSYWLCVCCWC